MTGRSASLTNFEFLNWWDDVPNGRKVFINRRAYLDSHEVPARSEWTFTGVDYIQQVVNFIDETGNLVQLYANKDAAYTSHRNRIIVHTRWAKTTYRILP